MKKNSTKKIIAVIALLLLAIGAGVYINHERTLHNDQNTTALSPGPDAVMTPAPVVTPVPEVAPATTTTATENNMVGHPVASTVRIHKHYYRKTGKKTAITDNDIDVATTREFGGNVPVATTQATAPDLNANKNTSSDKLIVTEQTKTVTKSNSKKSGRVNLAPEIGINMNTLYHNSTSNIYTNGFHAGVMVNVGLNDMLALQPELMYIMKGNEDKSTGTDFETTNEINTDRKRMLGYMEMPVNIVYKFGGKIGTSRFMIGAGPYISYLVNAQERVNTTVKDKEGATLSSDNSTSTSMADLNQFDFGAGGFIGCQTPKGFYAKAGAEWGFSDISKSQGGSKSSDRNNNYLISVGYIIGTKGKTY